MTSPPEIKAIETHYAGYRFRSRLEARWAVFFDTLGIEWQYEPQGFLIGPDETPYLPDFYLPRLGHPSCGIWVEVKGKPTRPDIDKAVTASGIDGLPYFPDGRTPDRGIFAIKFRMLLLGQIPPASATGALHTVLIEASSAKNFRMNTQPTQLHFTTWATRCFFDYSDGNDVSRVGYDLEQIGDVLPANCLEPRDWEATSHRRVAPDRDVVEAYRAARSARFEFGEQGAPTPPARTADIEPHITAPAEDWKTHPRYDAAPIDVVLASVVEGFQIDNAEGRVGALRECVPILSRRPPSQREKGCRVLAEILSLEVETVRRAVKPA